MTNDENMNYPEVSLMPRESDRLLDEAQRLDAEIDDKCRQLHAAFTVLFEQARLLYRMRTSAGYKLLGFELWGEYLATKPFGRTYQSFLLKLGHIDDPGFIIERQIPTSLVMDYVAATHFPHQVKKLVEDTWDQVKSLPTAKATKVINEHAKTNGDIFKKQREKREKQAEAPQLKVTSFMDAEPTHLMSFLETYRSLGTKEQFSYIRQMEQFLSQYSNKSY